MVKFNHRMLAIARQSRGFTQKDLAGLIDISQANLSKIEKGLLNVSDETVSQFSKVLNYPFDFFYQEEPRTPFSNIYFRKRASIPQKFLDIIFSEVKIILKSLDELFNFVDIKEYKKFTFDLTNGWDLPSVAVRLRELFKIPPGPIKNIITTLEDEGIIVYPYDSAHEKFDGLTAYTDRGYPVIFVNKNMPNDRIRFTIAHELIHLVCHIPCDIEPWRDVEREANYGAGEFLVPAKDCVNDFRRLNYASLTMWKAYWGVSKALIIRRAKDTNCIPESTYTYLMIELGRRNERKVEAGFVEIDEPKIIYEVLRLLRTDLEYDDISLASLAHLEVSDFAKYFDKSKNVHVKMRAISKIA